MKYTRKYKKNRKTRLKKGGLSPTSVKQIHSPSPIKKNRMNTTRKTNTRTKPTYYKSSLVTRRKY